MPELEGLRNTVGDLRQQMGEALGMLRSIERQQEDRTRQMEKLNDRLNEIEEVAERRMGAIEADLTALRRDHGSLAEQIKATAEPLKEFAEWQKRNRWLGTAIIGAGTIILTILTAVAQSVAGRIGERLYSWWIAR